MTQDNRNGLDHLMKAFDCAENAQKAFAAAGNIEGARIAQEASNKIYLSMEAAMRTCKRSGQAEAFGSGGGVEQYGTGGMMSEADYYANGGEIEDLDIDIDDDSIEVDDYAQGGKIRSDYGTWVVTDKGIREKVENAARIANVEIVDVKANDDYDADMFLVRKPSDARKLGSAYITTYGGLPAGGMTTRKMNQVREDGSFGSQKMEFGGQIELPL